MEFREWREKKGLSLGEMAKALGMSKSGVADIEGGRTTPSFGLVARIEKFTAEAVNPLDHYYAWTLANLKTYMNERRLGRVAARAILPAKEAKTWQENGKPAPKRKPPTARRKPTKPVDAEVRRKRRPKAAAPDQATT